MTSQSSKLNNSFPTFVILIFIWHLTFDICNCHVFAQDSIKTFSTENKNFDVRLFYSINGSRSNFKDGLLNISDRSLLPVTLLLPSAMLIYGRAGNHSYEENTGFLLGSADIITAITTLGLKYTIKRPRPYKTLQNVHYSKDSFDDEWSFPSGHSSFAFTSATLLAFRYPIYPQVYVPMFVWASLVAYGRPYWGMHYPGDVFAGALIGAGSAALTFALRKELLKFKNSIFGEKDKLDDNSIGGKTAWLFAGSFAASVVFNLITGKTKRSVQLSVLPSGYGNTGVQINFVKWF